MASDEKHYDVVIIGSGPGGYVCAIRAAQLGLRTACVEMAATLGGTCLNVGCIPSKALLESSERYSEAKHHLADFGVNVGEVSMDLNTMMTRKEDIVRQLTGGVADLFTKNKIDRLQGFGSIVDAQTVLVTADDGTTQEVKADAIVVATGSAPTSLRGVELETDRIVDSTGALSFPEVPKHLVLVGAGVIGLELGSVWARLGAEVTVLEYMDHILPGVDREVAKVAHKAFEAQGLNFVLGARVQAAEVKGDEVTVTWQDAEGAEHNVVGDRVLVAIGRRPYTDGLGCEAAGIALDKRGRIEVDGDFQTSLDGVFAIGDVIRGPMLAHKAEDEGIAIAELLAGGDGHLNYDAIPGIVYTDPEVAGVGKTEEQLKADGIPYRKGRYRFGPNGRAMALGAKIGLVKILAHKDTDRILGAHIVGARAGELIAELSLAIEFGASAEDVARSVHAHPTLSEIVREAALDVARRALHK